MGQIFTAFMIGTFAPEGKNLKESIINLELMVNLAKEKQEESGVKVTLGHCKFIFKSNLHEWSRN